MVWEIIYFDFALILLDLVAIFDLRKFIIDFLYVKRSRKNAAGIYRAQTAVNKFTLFFIKPLLKKYEKEFSLYHSLYLILLITLLPQYLILVFCNVTMGTQSLYVLGVFAFIKFVICFIVRINSDAKRNSIYRRKG